MLSHVEVKALLPHRYPMLLVDAITELEPWSRVVGVKNVTGNEPCYAHLSSAEEAESYAYPASLIIESFGQTAGVLLMGRRRHEGAPSDELMLFARLSGFRFDGTDVLPGDTLEHRVHLERYLPEVAVLRGEVWSRTGRVAAVDSVMVAFRPARAVSAARGRS